MAEENTKTALIDVCKEDINLSTKLQNSVSDTTGAAETSYA